MVQMYTKLLLFDPSNTNGIEGFFNYKLSGFGSGNGSNSGNNNGGGKGKGSAIIWIIIIILLLLKGCGN